ncbi:MAG: segregation/condensation protein A [Candidatus Marinimicrobia bacterium]|jgi:segregation and condensation protein A|nr:segregation/condensation protein A [Candidatus Neomarinimicrobiota bacterium]
MERKYQINLDTFEGPLDLLLYFIKRDELNIYDIPIAKITKEYLEYLNMMHTLDLQIAGEFVEMASNLMSIKAKMLLPRFSEANEDDDIEDPRNELVQRLLEYQQYKEMGKEMKELEEENISYFHRNPNLTYVDKNIDAKEILHKISLFDILTAFKNVLDKIPDESIPHGVQLEDVNIDDQTKYLYTFFIKKSKVNFSTVVKTIKNRVVLIVTFVAILEMIKTQQIRIYQTDLFEDFIIEKVE